MEEDKSMDNEEQDNKVEVQDEQQYGDEYEGGDVQKIDFMNEEFNQGYEDMAYIGGAYAVLKELDMPVDMIKEILLAKMEHDVSLTVAQLQYKMNIEMSKQDYLDKKREIV